DTARVVQVHDTGRGGIIVVFRQEMNGVPLYAHDAKVLLRRDGSLVAISGGLHPLATQTAKTAGTFPLPPPRALAPLRSAPQPPSKPPLPPPATHQRFDLKTAAQGGLSGVRFEVPARARKVYFAAEGGLIPAYYVEVFAAEEGAETDAYSYVVSARDG